MLLCLLEEGDMPIVTPVRAISAKLFGLADASGRRSHRATVRIVTDDRPRQVVMYQGEPFLPARSSDGSLAYVQTFRADPSFEIEARRT
jgi:archaeosine-15-forming tRNA-guanine transglycosylase